MPRPRRTPKRQPVKRVVPFFDAAEAWFWFMRASRARIDGARLSGDVSPDARPCEPDDIYRIAMGLRRARVIGDAHLRVLAEYGWREAPPDPRVREQEAAVRLWDEALDRLTTPLTARGIVAADER